MICFMALMSFGNASHSLCLHFLNVFFKTFELLFLSCTILMCLLFSYGGCSMLEILPFLDSNFMPSKKAAVVLLGMLEGM